MASVRSTSDGDPLRTGSGELVSRTCIGAGTVTMGSVARPFAVVPIRVTGALRTAYPADRNNGARWGGRGVSAAFQAGVSGRWGPVRVTVAPLVAWQENRSVAIVPASDDHPFRYPYHDIDWPQQFGSEPYGTVDWGQTAVAVTAGPVEVRAATENLWWGPARRYPILLGNSAPGFPHVAIATSLPLWAGIGFVRGRLMWGRVDESEYYDDRPENDHRMVTGFFADVSPWFLDGLTLGGGLVYHLPWDRPLSHLFDVFTFPVTEEENSRGNGLASITARWVLPGSGFEVYGELGREDFWLNTEDLFTEPDHSLGHVLGFSKTLPSGEAVYEVQGEWTSLQTHSEHRSLNGTRPRFYAHQYGHTHRGQLLGSSIGPGSDAQFLGVTRLHADRTAGIYLERIRHDEDAYYEYKVQFYGFRGHDVEWTVGLHGMEPVGSLRIDWGASLSRRKNRNFIGLDGRNWDFLRETNLTVELGGWWLPDG